MKAAVIGAGVMGAGIAQTLATFGAHVSCVDISEEVLAKAQDIVTRGRFGFERAVARDKLTAEEAAAAQERLAFTTDLGTAAKGADIVIEAIPEDISLKINLFTDLGRTCDPNTVLASNSSGFPIEALAAASGRQGRVLGWHWASPAQIQPLAEIVVTEETDQDAIDLVVALAERCNKHPIVVRDNPRVWGYVVNRVLFAALDEARRIVDEGGATAPDIDGVLRDAFGWPNGVFGLVRGAVEGWEPGRTSSVATLSRETTPSRTP